MTKLLLSLLFSLLVYSVSGTMSLSCSSSCCLSPTTFLPPPSPTSSTSTTSTSSLPLPPPSPSPSPSKRAHKDFHPFQDFRNNQKEKKKNRFTDKHRLLQCKEYLQQLDPNAKCLHLQKKSNKATLACNCLKVLEDEVAHHAIATRMVLFYKQSRDEQMLTVMDWLWYTQAQGGNNSGKKAMFLLPFIKDINDEFYEHEHEEIFATLSTHRVCKSAIRTLLDFGRSKWRTAERCVKKCVLPKHGNSNKRSNNGKYFDTYVRENLETFFLDLEQLGTPQATRVVRDLTGSGLRDGEEGVTKLPPAFSCRSMYRRWVEERGFVVEPNQQKGNGMKATRNREVQLATQHICSFGRFRSYWYQEHQKLCLTVCVILWIVCM